MSLSPLTQVLRDEEEAVAGYTQLVRDPYGPALTEGFQRLLDGHRLAVDLLGGRGRTGGARLDARGLPSLSTLWGRALAAGPLFSRILATLRGAEFACLGSYESAIASPDLTAGDRVLLVSVLLPRQRAHAAMVDRLETLL